jgi:hypothetical protein
MIDETLFKSDYLGKDGFIWWIGQVAGAKSWKAQALHANFQDSTKKDKNWPERCKVRIIGYHSFRTTELSDEDLPWAHVMMDPAFGSGQGGEGVSNNLTGGEVCFGFFLDSNDAQQPVVVGLLHRHRMVQNFPNDEDFAFRPFTGHPGNVPSTKREKINNTQPGVPPNPITPTMEAANPGIAFTDSNYTFDPNLNLGVDYGPINLNFGDKIWNTDETLAPLAFLKKGTFTYSKPSGCRDNMIGQITQILQDFIGFTNGIQKYASTYIDPILNEVVDITQSIKSTARSIGGIIRLIINSIRGALLKCIISLFKKFIGIVVPCPQQAIAAQATKSILDQIFCLFEKLLPEIISFIEGYLEKMVDSVFNAPICAVEQFVAGILTNVMGSIESSIDMIMSGISWLTGGLTKVFDVLNQASSLANKIYSFIGCDELKCKTPSQWVSTIGPSNVASDNWSKMVGNINVVKGVSDGLGSIEGALAGLSLYGQGSNYNSCNDSVNNPKTQNDLSYQPPGVVWKNCIPPIVSIYGDGLGAKLIPIVGKNGSIISVEISSGGMGYTYPPVLTIVDKSGYGSKATVTSYIDSSGKIINALVTNGGKGYCKGDYQDNDDPNFNITLTSSKNKVYEGDSFDIKVASSTIPENTEIKYKITGVNSTDIKQNIEGILSLKNGSAAIMIDTLVDNVVDYKELVFNLVDYNKSLSVFIQDISNSDLNKSYRLSADYYVINEGNTFNINLTTKNIKDNTLVPFTISGYSEGVIENEKLYSNFKIINNKSNLKFKTKKGIIKKNEIFKLRLENDKASVGVLIKLVTSTGVRTDPKVCIKELVVIKPGIGYTGGDTITDGVNTYYPIISPVNGVIFAIKPLKAPICGFSSTPNITINSTTGIGAEILPIMTLETSLSNIDGIVNGTQIAIGTSVINVVDCV